MVSGCAQNPTTVYYTTGTSLRDITSGIKAGIRESKRFSANYARNVVSQHGQTEEALRQIWKDARRRWPYREDEPGKEVISSPCEMDRRGYADCKDYTVWISGILKNMGIPHDQRIIFYDAAMKQGHIFNVAYLDGEEYIIDPVHSRFDRTFSHLSAMDLDHQSISGPNGQPCWLVTLGLLIAGWWMTKRKTA